MDIDVEVLATVLGLDVEARPDGPSPLDDEPDLAGRQGVEGQLYLPVCERAVEPLSQPLPSVHPSPPNAVEFGQIGGDEHRTLEIAGAGDRSANARHASTASSAAWVARDWLAAVSVRRGRSFQKRRATGASRISEPLPAECGSVEPASGSPVRKHRPSASRGSNSSVVPTASPVARPKEGTERPVANGGGGHERPVVDGIAREGHPACRLEERARARRMPGDVEDLEVAGAAVE